MTTRDPAAPHATCGACERDDALDEHVNPAGLDALAYRVGEYGRFLARMTGWLSRQVVPPNEPSSARRPLAELSTRAEDDPALALVDAWSCALDVLTFYQERIANEGFLRTATERRSVLELARAIGYDLNPGVAASVHLAFTLLDTEKAPDEVTLSRGLQVLSVPGPGELPQTFETSETILARPEWNAMRPVQREQHTITQGEHELYLAGLLSASLSVGSELLIVDADRVTDVNSSRWDVRTVLEVIPDRDAGVTRVVLDKGYGWSSASSSYVHAPPVTPRVFALSRPVHAFGHSAPDARIASQHLPSSLFDIDGNNPDLTEWKNFAITHPVHVVDAVEEFVPGSFVVFTESALREIYVVEEVEDSARTDYSLSLKTTAITHLSEFTIRTASARVTTREFTLATRPLMDETGERVTVSGNTITLASTVPHLDRERVVIVQGRAKDGGDVIEEAVIDSVVDDDDDEPHTILKLKASLANELERDSVVVLGNVARATHGKTVAREVLGSGDGSRRFQAFALRQRPLTYTSESDGIRSSLTLRVGGVAWTPVPSTHGLGPNDRVFVPRVDDDATTTVTFGDGVNGARLPTGSENVTAEYRAGIGAAGAVAAGKLTILTTRRQGVKSVTNPREASGAEDPEVLADARVNAPVTVLTFDRLVSVRDYEDYARAYPGIGKAKATRLWDGRRWWVHLTLATAEGSVLETTNPLHDSLKDDIDKRRDPVQKVMFDTYRARFFKARGTVRVDRDYVADEVIAAVVDTIESAFSFERREFGQPVTGAELLALAHRVAGVVAVDLDALWHGEQAAPSPDETAPSSWVLYAAAARWGGAAVEPAELLLLAEGGAEFTKKQEGTP